jgi:hypothetical protein
MGMKIHTTNMEISMEIPQKAKELPYDLVIPLLGINPKECKSVYISDTSTLMFISALFTIDKLWEQHGCTSIDESIKIIWCTCTQ